MELINRETAEAVLKEHVQDEYQQYHAHMVARAVEGYAKKFGENIDEWYITALLHDVDFEEHPTEHPGPSMSWMKEWGFTDDMLHAVEAHAYGYNGFTTMPKSKLAAALMACDELCGIFYAYKKVNPVPYNQMKASSIKKRLKEEKFAPKINRSDIERGVNALGVDMSDHIADVANFLGDM